MDIPNLCAKAANSDMNSDLDCSDVDFDSDSQNKPNPHDEKNVTQKRDGTCEKLKKMYFTRVSTDSTETDCSIEFKGQTQTSNESLPESDNKTLMECDSSKKADNFCIVQNIVSSTDDIDVNKEHLNSLGDHKTVDLIAKCVPNNECLTVSIADVVDTNISLETDSTENSI